MLCVTNAMPCRGADPRYGPDLEARDRWNSSVVSGRQRNNVPIARLLLQSGANADCRDADGNTPLHMAAEAGHLEMCELLMDFGARVRAQNSKGATPAHKVRSRCLGCCCPAIVGSNCCSSL